MASLVLPLLAASIIVTLCHLWPYVIITGTILAVANAATWIVSQLLYTERE